MVGPSSGKWKSGDGMSSPGGEETGEGGCIKSLIGSSHRLLGDAAFLCHRLLQKVAWRLALSIINLTLSEIICRKI
jgi:hypothetical protein